MARQIGLKQTGRHGAALRVMAAAAALCAAGAVQAQETFKVGIVSFLSG